MKLSEYILPTHKEDPADASVQSHKLMIRAGLIHKESAGMYAYLPLGLRVLRKIINIVRDEMDMSGALEFLMPELTSSELWKESGRWESMGSEMFRVKDRSGFEYSLAPTHEEAFTGVIRSFISSYRDLPVNVYQINTKFRDEIRPRFGVIRSKEFIMKDAYSFDINETGLEESYQIMRKTYRKIFQKCGLDTIQVEADTGSMGGSDSEEFMVASDIGEEVLLLCRECGYKANQEKAEYRISEKKYKKENPAEMEEVDTPDIKTIEELVDFFKVSKEKFFKSIVYLADEKPVMAVVTGDRDINEQKLMNILGAERLELAEDSIVEEVTGASVGFAGPVTDKNIRMIFDIGIKKIANGITGANKNDKHIKNVNPGRDFEIKETADITLALENDACPKCGSPMYSKKGIEVGHIFKLGYKYTESMGVTVLDESGKAVTPIMGCYGIGINRTMAAVIEQHNDSRGIIWPDEVSPFHVHMIRITRTDEEKNAADEIYNILCSNGIDVLYDDRDASPGFKFADADLVGIPVRITIGKGYFNSGDIEIKFRREDKSVSVKKADLIKKILSIIKP